jgi:hypothetical protein
MIKWNKERKMLSIYWRRKKTVKLKFLSLKLYLLYDYCLEEVILFIESGSHFFPFLFGGWTEFGWWSIPYLVLGDLMHGP